MLCQRLAGRILPTHTTYPPYANSLEQAAHTTPKNRKGNVKIFGFSKTDGDFTGESTKLPKSSGCRAQHAGRRSTMYRQERLGYQKRRHRGTEAHTAAADILQGCLLSPGVWATESARALQELRGGGTLLRWVIHECQRATAKQLRQ